MSNSRIIESQIVDVLKNVRGTTFAEISFNTKVPTAAAHKGTIIEKRTVANVQLFNNLNAFTNAYAMAVKRSAGVDTFEPSENYFTHTDCYSIVEHKTNGKKYLFAIFNNAKSEYVIDGEPVKKEDVVKFLTPSSAEKFLKIDTSVHNVANNVTHDVQVRTISLDNITHMKANKQEISAISA